MILGDINDQWLLVSVIFVSAVDGGICACFSYLGFADMGLSIACVFVGVANFLGLEFSF